MSLVVRQSSPSTAPLHECHLRPSQQWKTNMNVLVTGSAFYKAVFNWNFSASHLGAPEHKLLVFTVPEASVPFEGIMRLVDEISTGTKIYLYVESMANAIQV